MVIPPKRTNPNPIQAIKVVTPLAGAGGWYGIFSFFLSYFSLVTAEAMVENSAKGSSSKHVPVDDAERVSSFFSPNDSRKNHGSTAPGRHGGGTAQVCQASRITWPGPGRQKHVIGAKLIRDAPRRERDDGPLLDTRATGLSCALAAHRQAITAQQL